MKLPTSQPSPFSRYFNPLKIFQPVNLNARDNLEDQETEDDSRHFIRPEDPSTRSGLCAVMSPNLCQLNPAHRLTTAVYVSKYATCFPSKPRSFKWPLSFMFTHRTSTIYVTRPAHLMLLYLMTIIFEDYKT